MARKKVRIEPSHIKVKMISHREAIVPIMGSVLLTKEDGTFYVIVSANNTYWQISKEEYDRLDPILTQVRFE